mgnify:CR=1 FL=1
MSTIHFETHRRRLLNEKAAISALLSDHNGAFQRSVRAEPCDEIDAACEVTDTIVEDEIAALEDRRLDAVDEALQRLMSGIYGVCADCGNPISEDRLQALPDAALCVHCQEKFEAFGPPRLLSA